MSDKPNISFGDGAKIDTFQTGENATVVHGDQVAGDKVGQQVQGDNLGTMDQVNITGGDYNAKCKEAVGKLLTELADAEPLEHIAPDDEATPINPPLDEYHPLSLLGTINEMADRGEPPCEEDAQTLRDRFTHMLTRVGTAGRKVLVSLGPIAVAGMRATAQITPPWNIVCPIVEAAVRQFGQSSAPQPAPQNDWGDGAQPRGW